MNGTWRIEMLGGLRAVRPEQTVTKFQTQKAGALLAYLAFYRHRNHAREELMDLLWSDADVSTLRNRFKQAVWSLRRQLEPPGTQAGSVFVGDRFHLQLNSVAIETDVSEFEGLIRQAGRVAEAQAKASLLARAVHLYRGELLPGFYEPWVEAERQRLADAYLGALSELVRLKRTAGEVSEAIDYARRVIAIRFKKRPTVTSCASTSIRGKGARRSSSTPSSPAS